MKKSPFLFAALIVSAALAASSPFRSATVASSKTGPASSVIQSSSEKVYVRLEPDEATPGKTVGVSWVALDVASSTIRANQKVVTASLKAGGGPVYFSVSRPPQGWPIGTYRAEVSLEGKPALALPFEVVSIARLEALSLGAKETGPSSTRFSPSSPEVNLRLKLMVPDPAGLPIRVRWIAEKTDGAEPGYVINDQFATMTGKDGALSLSKPNAGWPVGTYRVEVRLGRPNGPVAANLPFTVSK